MIKNYMLFLKLSSLKTINRLYVIITAIFIVLLFTVSGGIYFATSRVMSNNLKQQMQETINQSSKHINERLTFVLQQFSAMQADKTFKEITNKAGTEGFLADYIDMSNLFEKTRMQNSKMIESIIFIRNDGIIFNEAVKMIKPLEEYKKSDWYHATINNKNIIVWSGANEDSFLNEWEDKYSYIISVQVMADDFGPLGVLAFRMKEAYLQVELNDIKLGDDSEIIIVDDANNVLSSSNERYKDEHDYIISHDYTKNNLLYIKNKKIVVVHSKLPINDWKIIGIIPESNISNSSNIIGGIILVLTFISMFLFTFVSRLVIKKVTKPIQNLTDVMKSVRNGNLDARFNSSENDEIATLGHTFNEMLDKIQMLLKQVKNERDMKLYAELKALQEQISSHFLYNTLDSIYWLGKCGQGEKAGEMAADLANFIRRGLNKGKSISNVKKELEHIKTYLKIQEYRYNGRFKYEINVDDEIMDIEIPKLTLQPIVENSLLHGIENIDYMGRIEIKGSRAGDYIKLWVIDNGIGMDTERIKQQMQEYSKQNINKNSSGYGLFNLYKRLRLLYDKECDISFEPNKPSGVVTTITLLANKNIDEEAY